jgi:hypothetical protein
VPPDFHTHNDSVAAALMTLAGDRHREVTFNFPISPVCAETLRRFYGDLTCPSVDPVQQPRQRGRRLGLLFSGGVDSTATWIILNQALGGDFVVITSHYGGHFEFEAVGFGDFHRDVTCRTDLRLKRWDRLGRFNFAVPLLYADYLDLAGVCTGHTIGHATTNLGSTRLGSPAIWTEMDLAINAGGLDEQHVLRSLTTIGENHLFLHHGLDLLEMALIASELPGNPKRYTKEIVLRVFLEEAGVPVPHYLRQLWPTTDTIRLGHTPDRDHRALYLLKHRRNLAFQLCPDFNRVDLSVIDGLHLNFLERYSPTLTELLPQPLRTQVTDVFHACGIAPYDTRDLEEIEVVCDFLAAAAKLPRRAARRRRAAATSG